MTALGKTCWTSSHRRARRSPFELPSLSIKKNSFGIRPRDVCHLACFIQHNSPIRRRSLGIKRLSLSPLWLLTNAKDAGSLALLRVTPRAGTDHPPAVTSTSGGRLAVLIGVGVLA